MDKRTFIKQLSAIGLGSTIPFMDVLAKSIEEVAHLTPEKLAANEDFWVDIRAGYKLNSAYINLENGYYCMMPQETLNIYLKNVKEVNFLASRYMRTVQLDNRNLAREQLVIMAGCTFDEVIITRNTTESLDLVIGGQDWKEGDEAIYAEQDYGLLMDM